VSSFGEIATYETVCGLFPHLKAFS
jgi:hypothetical protein